MAAATAAVAKVAEEVRAAVVAKAVVVDLQVIRVLVVTGRQLTVILREAAEEMHQLVEGNRRQLN